MPHIRYAVQTTFPDVEFLILKNTCLLTYRGPSLSGTENLKKNCFCLLEGPE